jgi:hypothetical protein
MATSTSNFANLLTRVYNREKFAPFERALTPFLDSLEDAPNQTVSGAGLYFGIRTGDAHNTGAVAETGSFPVTSQPTALQGTVNPVQIVSTIGLTEQFLRVAINGGTLGGVTGITDHVDMAMRNLMSTINRLTVAGHGTGRLAVVEANTSSATTFVCRVPEHVLQLRPNMRIGFYDTDTSGSLQSNIEAISAINFETRTVTIGNARSLTAGWGVYQALAAAGGTGATTYGVAPNGLRGIVDDGTLQGTIFGITRSSNPAVNATVLSASPTTQSYSERLVRKAINRVFFQVGVEADEIWTNRGVVSAHLDHTIPDRRYAVNAGDGVPSYEIGYKKLPVFNNAGKDIPFKVDSDYPCRELSVVSKSLFRRHVVQKAGWLNDGNGDASSAPYLFQTPATTTYALSKLAALYWSGNVYHMQPRANVRVTDIADVELAGDAA